MSSESSGLSKIFNFESITKFVLKTAVIGVGLFILGGIMDYSLFHNHPMGQEMIAYFNDGLMNFYDWVAEEVINRPDLMQPTEFAGIPAPNPDDFTYENT